MENLLNKTNYPEKLHKSTEFYNNYLHSVYKELTNNLDLVISPYFMLLEHHIKDVHLIMKHFEGENKPVLDKKSKYVQNLIESYGGQKVICCSETNIEHLKDYLKKRRIKFISIDEKDRVGHRLFALMQFKKIENEFQILVITPLFLKSLNINKFNQLILFDFLEDQRELIRILAKFPKESSESKMLQILYDEKDEENSNDIIEYLKNKSTKK